MHYYLMTIKYEIGDRVKYVLGWQTGTVVWFEGERISIERDKKFNIWVTGEKSHKIVKIPKKKEYKKLKAISVYMATRWPLVLAIIFKWYTDQYPWLDYLMPAIGLWYLLWLFDYFKVSKK